MDRRKPAALVALIAAACGGREGAVATDAAVLDAGFAPESGAYDAGFACDCRPSPPWGFRYVTYTKANWGQMACPSGWAAPEHLVDVTGGDAPSCKCTCDAPTSVSCNITSVGLFAGGGVCQGQVQSFATSSGCATAQWNVTSSSTLVGALVPNVVPTAACGTPHATTVIPPLVQTPVDVCSQTNLFGGCATSEVCLPPGTLQQQEYKLCVESADVSAFDTCPPGFPNRHMLAASATDTRACESCSCWPSVQCNAVATLYSDGNCTTPEATITNKCGSLGTSSVSVGSFTISTTPVATCEVGGSLPQGGVTYDAPRLLCCAW